MMGRGRMEKAILPAVVAGVLMATPAPGEAGNGEDVYARRCAGCHGEEGDGSGPGAERLNPPPRDFTEGMYKMRTTGFDDIVPNDSDLVRTISDGMP